MPTDKVLNRNFKDLFESTVRYEVPFFQRGYAWEQRQWKKLMDDIREEIIKTVDDNNFEDAEHFFGPIVVLEKTNAPHPSLKRYLIIDGQQRITTVYLMLILIKNALDGKAHLSQEAQTYSAEIAELTRNHFSCNGDDYLKLKVFSSKGDRLPTFLNTFGENPSSPYLSEDQLLYVPEQNQVDQFVKFFKKSIKNYDVVELWKIYQALIRSLKIVWIPLDEKKDDPQAIFESLNDAGMPLSASELLCNYLFRPIINETTNEHEKLHNEKWLKARKAIGEQAFEDYLRNLFSIDEAKRVGVGRRMYVHFKSRNRNLSKDAAVKHLNNIFDYTIPYNHIQKPIIHPHPNKEIKKILIAVHDTNMTSSAPFLMSVIMANTKELLSDNDTTALLKETNVLLVRRKITSLPVTKYDTFFPSLLKRLINEPNKVQAFQSAVQEEGLWVSDQEFENAFVNKGLYNRSELNFTRYVLQEIDKYMQPYGELPDYTTISTIEHILPQTINEPWREYLKEDAINLNLPRVTDTIGNLCLNSQPANSTFGQKPFNEKQTLYSDISALARDVKKRSEPWNISAIEQRSKDLAKIALKIWKWKI